MPDSQTFHHTRPRVFSSYQSISLLNWYPTSLSVRFVETSLLLATRDVRSALHTAAIVASPHINKVKTNVPTRNAFKTTLINLSLLFRKCIHMTNRSISRSIWLVRTASKFSTSMTLWRIFLSACGQSFLAAVHPPGLPGILCLEKRMTIRSTCKSSVQTRNLFASAATQLQLDPKYNLIHARSHWLLESRIKTPKLCLNCFKKSLRIKTVLLPL